MTPFVLLAGIWDTVFNIVTFRDIDYLGKLFGDIYQFISYGIFGTPLYKPHYMSMEANNPGNNPQGSGQSGSQGHGWLNLCR